jgi:hypothetical protein
MVTGRAYGPPGGGRYSLRRAAVGMIVTTYRYAGRAPVNYP